MAAHASDCEGQGQCNLEGQDGREGASVYLPPACGGFDQAPLSRAIAAIADAGMGCHLLVLRKTDGVRVFTKNTQHGTC